MPGLVKINRGRAVKVHQANANNHPVCGGGRSGKSILAWQEDIGAVSCRRCKQLLEFAAKRAAKEKPEPLPA